MKCLISTVKRIVLPKYKTVIFVNGCFWHHHDCRYFEWPRNNTEFWRNNAYLEVHHIVWLAKGGADALENVVALCPNCHRKMHINPNDDDIKALKKKALDFMKEEKG